MDELYYLIGVRYSDATLLYKTYWRDRGSYKYSYIKAEFNLTVRDKDFCEKFAKCLNKVFNNGKVRRWQVQELYITKVAKGHVYPNLLFYRCKDSCRKDVEYLMRICNELNLEKLTKNQQIEILRGLFDGDGSVAVYIHKRPNSGGDVEHTIGYGKNPKTFKLFTDILHNLSIEYSIHQLRDASGNSRLRFSKKGFIKMYKLFGNKLTILRKDKKIKKWFKDCGVE